MRLITGFLALLALLFIGGTTLATAGDASTNDASAVQIIQVYSEGCFYAIIAIGLAISIYIATRNDG